MKDGIILETLSRREFLKSSVGIAAAVASSTQSVSPSFAVQGANDRIRVACVGLHKKGRSHIREFLTLAPKGVDLVALCDVDDHVLQERAAGVEEQTGKRPQTFRDIRKLLEDKSIDAISVATPNHWHALITIWACQAGKDVYVEKPASWCIREGRQMVEA
ncbi:MAG: Gfo/Idh/MocA family oxidoreductase, partial [Candidatus Omnitrophica bacterium]|nr:Gfo/Idh/MocA family oxidoreductase [Candidatus Omnitrophota bacterium]